MPTEEFTCPASNFANEHVRLRLDSEEGAIALTAEGPCEAPTCLVQRETGECIEATVRFKREAPEACFMKVAYRGIGIRSAHELRVRICAPWGSECGFLRPVAYAIDANEGVSFKYGGANEVYEVKNPSTAVCEWELR